LPGMRPRPARSSAASDDIDLLNRPPPARAETRCGTAVSYTHLTLPALAYASRALYRTVFPPGQAADG
jgi:hypothetical protein